MARLLAFLFAIAAGPVAAETVIDQLRKNGSGIVELGREGSLAGYLVSPPDGNPYSLYVTSEGHAIAGLLYDPEGRLVTQRQVRTVRTAQGGPGPDFNRAVAARGFELGTRGPRVVLFGDPSCSFSRSAVARLARSALAGEFRLKVVPVGILGAQGARDAAAILSDPDPALAWFDRSRPAVTPNGVRQLRRNNRIFESWGESAVPLLLWTGQDGRISRHVGDLLDPGAWQKALIHE